MMDCDDRATDCELAQIDEWHFVTQNVVPLRDCRAFVRSPSRVCDLRRASARNDTLLVVDSGHEGVVG